MYMISEIAINQETNVTKAKLHTDLIEQTLIALSRPTLDTKLKLYHLIGLWLDLHPDADVYERFKARTALTLLRDSIGEGAKAGQDELETAAA